MGVALSTITAKGQTTVPKAVRQALGVDYGGRIAYHVGEDGVMLSRADDSEDLSIAAFLGFLANDIRHQPQKIRALSPDLAKRIVALVDGIDVNLDDEIDGDVSL